MASKSLVANDSSRKEQVATKQLEWVPGVPEQPPWPAELLVFQQDVDLEPFFVVVHFLHFVSKICLNLINCNQIKNGEKSQLQNVNLVTSYLALLAVSAKSANVVPQYRCCATSGWWWHILVFAFLCCGFCTIYFHFLFFLTFLTFLSLASISAACNSNSRRQVENRPTWVPSGASQLHWPAAGQAWFFFGLSGVAALLCFLILWFCCIWKLKFTISFDRAAPQLAATALKIGQRGSTEAPSSSKCQLPLRWGLFCYWLQPLHNLFLNS